MTELPCCKWPNHCSRAHLCCAADMPGGNVAAASVRAQPELESE
jgi:hypothetical protein